jgi:hypothetical protein
MSRISQMQESPFQQLNVELDEMRRIKSAHFFCPVSVHFD